MTKLANGEKKRHDLPLAAEPELGAYWLFSTHANGYGWFLAVRDGGSTYSWSIVGSNEMYRWDQLLVQLVCPTRPPV